MVFSACCLPKKHVIKIKYIYIAPEWYAVRGLRGYDYTKDAKRYALYLMGRLPRNYSLTFSASERVTDAQIVNLVNRGGTVAVVLTDKPRETFRGVPMVNGDESDDRTLDTRGVVVGLKAKGKMRDHAAYRGFVRDNDDEVTA